MAEAPPAEIALSMGELQRAARATPECTSNPRARECYEHRKRRVLALASAALARSGARAASKAASPTGARGTILHPATNRFDLGQRTQGRAVAEPRASRRTEPQGIFRDCAQPAFSPRALSQVRAGGAAGYRGRTTLAARHRQSFHSAGG